MGTRKSSCGSVEIEYDDTCTFFCVCAPGFPCAWTTICEGKKTSGTGLEVRPPDGDPGPKHIGFDGPADAFAILIADQTGRNVEVPARLVDQRITIDVDGGWDAAIEAAGFQDSSGPVIDSGGVGGDPPILG
jgi:hypothetical protein